MEKLNARQIYLLRKKLALDQGSFARRIGVTRETVNRWENDANQPRGLALRELLKLKTEETSHERN